MCFWQAFGVAELGRVLRVRFGAMQKRQAHRASRSCFFTAMGAIMGFPLIDRTAREFGRAFEGKYVYFEDEPRRRAAQSSASISARFAPWVTDTGIRITIRQPRTRRCTGNEIVKAASLAASCYISTMMRGNWRGLMSSQC